MTSTRAVRAYTTVVALTLLAVLGTQFLSVGFCLPSEEGLRRVGGDFRGFYDAGRLSKLFQFSEAGERAAAIHVAGSPPFKAEDPATFAPMSASIFAVYPPAVSAFFGWLGSFSVERAYAIFGAAQVGALFFAFWVYRRSSPQQFTPRWPFVAWIGFGPAFQALAYGQNSVLTLAVVVACGYLLHSGFKVWAGFVAGLVWWKPQYSLVLLGCLCMARLWPAVAGWCVAFALFIAGNSWLGGAGWLGRWLRNTLVYSSSVPGAYRGGTASFVELVRTWFPGSTVASAFGVSVAAAGLFLLGVAWARGRDRPWPDLVALAGPVAVLCSPHSWCYEMTLALPCVLVVARRSPRFALALHSAATISVVLINPAGEVLRVAMLVALPILAHLTIKQSRASS